jgi:eukaryotic-like serine/threonine-protein kinase
MPGAPGFDPPPGAPPPPDPLIGKLLDRYQVVRKIGEGGMGSVYSVEHVMLRKRMAMKLLRAELSRNQELVTRFQNEAIAASRIGQENIVQVTDFGRTPEGLVYFVMEELQGQSLAEAIRRDRGLTPERSIVIALQVCRALHAAHAVGIIHRDLKPENIVLTEREGQGEFAKVLDFGISKVSEGVNSGSGDTQRLTQLGMIVGTPEYMSPEQASGKQVDHRSDVYSLGVVLFEMLTGRLPFEGDNALQVLMKHQTDPAPPFDEVRPDRPVPAVLEVVVQRALAKRPQDRHQSMADLLGDLQRAREGLRVAAGTPPRWEIERVPARFSPPPIDSGRVAEPLELATPEPPPASDSAMMRAVRPRRTGLWLFLAALVLAGALLYLNGQYDLPNLVRKTYISVRAEAPPAALDFPALKIDPTPDVVPVVVAPAQPVLPPPAPEEPKAPAAVRPHKTAPMAPVAHKVPRAPPPAPTATPAAAPADPYQKVDDLKQPY